MRQPPVSRVEEPRYAQLKRYRRPARRQSKDTRCQDRTRPLREPAEISPNQIERHGVQLFIEL